ncbi:MAG: hypothetical protein HXX09_06110 [Bacteroidetes bacterium]|nr:hypothetical protein [Bacteroidota bacterium]
MSFIFKSSYKYLFLFSLSIFLITSYFSEGYLHPDEHFQILEFANYKLGNTLSTDLPWEFHEKIRPALQPTIAFVIIKALNIISVKNPFTIAFILRFFTAILAWFVISKTCLLLIKNFQSEIGKKIFLLLSLFLWFIPFINVRFSSENLSAITFLGAIYLILKFFNESSSKKICSLGFAGFLLGLAFFFRFQIAFAIFGLALWLLIIQKVNWKQILVLVLAGLLSISFCIYLDYWFYGGFELTPINYFFSNIVENKAANWGITPWWNYFNYFILQAIPPISIILLGFFFWGIFKKPKDIFVWCILPFLVAHFAVGHKEMRFLFPIVFGFIYIISIGIDQFIIRRKFEKLARIVFIICVIINIPLLIVKMITPAQEAIAYYKFLYNTSQEKQVTLLCTEKSVYDLVGVEVNFYKSGNVNCLVFNNNDEISSFLEENKPESILLLEKKISTKNNFDGYSNESIFCLFPKWLINFDFNNWQSRARIWNIKELKKNK